MNSLDVSLQSIESSLNEERLMTYAAGYREGVSLLSKAGVANAPNEALWLLENALGISRLDIYTEPDMDVTGSSWFAAKQLLLRRVAGEPLQYILGTQIFRGLDIAVQPGVLIPRPESELVIEEVHVVQLSHNDLQMADIGTGSGCLSIALAVEFPHAMVYATDCSDSAIEIAESNAKRHMVQDRIKFLCGDLLEPLNVFPRIKSGFSVIVANPPYIPTDQIKGLLKDVRDFEPHLALDGGMDGLSFYRRLLRDAPQYLQPEGNLVMEVGEGQAQRICEEVEGLSAWRIQNIRQDDAGIDRVICLEKKG
jgi:release factor glutamine methyltransferase